jgi:hypothetical protein
MYVLIKKDCKKKSKSLRFTVINRERLITLTKMAGQYRHILRYPLLFKNKPATIAMQTLRCLQGREPEMPTRHSLIRNSPTEAYIQPNFYSPSSEKKGILN